MKKFNIIGVFISILFLFAGLATAEECKDASGTPVEITSGSLCSSATNRLGDVAPYGTPDGKLNISDAVVALRMSLGLITGVDAAYKAKADVAPLCIKGDSSCTKPGDEAVGISDAVVILRLALGLVDATTVAWPTTAPVSFNMTGATSLQAMDQLVTKVTALQEEDPSLLHYRIVDPESHQTRAASGAGTNLIAVKSDGTSKLAVQSDLPVKVMYSVASSDQAYVYLALEPTASQALIAQTNCALYRIKVADNSSSCVMEGIYLQEFDDAYKKKFGGVKPIQFDEKGTLYFAGSVFTKSGSTIDKGTWKPLIYQNDLASGKNTAITHDAMQIKFFMVLSTGELVYQGANVLNGEEKLWLFQNGSGFELSSTAPAFLSRDTYRTLFWGGRDTQQRPGIWFARSKESGGILKAILYTSHQNGEAANTEQVMVGDDGGLYGVFSGAAGVEVDSLMPYQNTAKAKFDSPMSGLLRNPAIQISQGYLYYLDKIDPSDGTGNKDVIHKIDLYTGTKETLLSDRRYELHAWRLSGRALHFSGQDLKTMKLISGQIDTLKVRQGLPVDQYMS
ncbi:MAG: hypothetical protein H7839_24670 [Magnetococcus sp. YQC-5]